MMSVLTDQHLSKITKPVISAKVSALSSISALTISLTPIPAGAKRAIKPVTNATALLPINNIARLKDGRIPTITINMDTAIIPDNNHSIKYRQAINK